MAFPQDAALAPDRDFAVYRKPSGTFDFCPQDFLLSRDLVGARDLPPAAAEEIADRLNAGGSDEAWMSALGSLVGVPVGGRIS